jgi:hypothetical protein
MAGGETMRRVARAFLVAVCVAAAWPSVAIADDQPAEGPPAPEAESVLVLPTRVPQALAAERATFDLLIATSLQELGFTVVDAGRAAKELDASAADLTRARELYLDLRFEEALAAARAVREAHLAHRGDLLGDPALTAAELMMVRVSLDLGDQPQALELAVAVLEREPGLRLDPVDYPPAMQALWVAALDKQAAMQPKEHAVESLAAVGRRAGTTYVAAAMAKRTPDGVDWLVLQIVPTAEGGQPSRHPMILGERGTWSKAVRLKLEERFPPPAPEVATGPLIPVVPPGPTDGGKKVWYKSWWFWGSVGLVVVAGAVVGIAIGVDKGDSSGSIGTDGQPL